MPPPSRPPIGLALARTARVVTQAFERALAEAGGSVSTWQVLVLVRSDEWGAQARMADAMREADRAMTVSAPRADVLAPRLAPGTRREIGALNALIVRAIGLATGGRPPNVFTTLARHRRLFRAWLRFAGRLMPRGTLPRADTELVILRVAHHCGCD